METNSRGKQKDDGGKKLWVMERREDKKTERQKEMEAKRGERKNEEKKKEEGFNKRSGSKGRWRQKEDGDKTKREIERRGR